MTTHSTPASYLLAHLMYLLFDSLYVALLPRYVLGLIHRIALAPTLIVMILYFQVCLRGIGVLLGGSFSLDEVVHVLIDRVGTLIWGVWFRRLCRLPPVS